MSSTQQAKQKKNVELKQNKVIAANAVFDRVSMHHRLMSDLESL